jgi:hypothetical protein
MVVSQMVMMVVAMAQMTDMMAHRFISSPGLRSKLPIMPAQSLGESGNPEFGARDGRRLAFHTDNSGDHWEFDQSSFALRVSVDDLMRFLDCGFRRPVKVVIANTVNSLIRHL